MADKNETSGHSASGHRDRQQRIEARAHLLWNAAGRPQGQHEEHWDEAERQIDVEDAANQEAAAAPSGDVPESEAETTAATPTPAPTTPHAPTPRRGGD